MTFLRAALSRISLRLVLLQCFGNLVLFAAGLLWLKIPDSHIWQLLFSVVLGALILAAVFAMHTFTLRQLRRASSPLRLWLGSLLLGAWLVLAALLTHISGHLQDHVSDRAGYWNSRLGPHLRTTLTYNRLIDWQQDVITCLLWIVLPALLLPFIVESVCRPEFRSNLSNAARLLRDWRHWAAVILLNGLVLWITPKLVYWHPADSVGGEIASALIRLPLAILLDVLLLLLLFAIESELLARSDAGRHAIAKPLTQHG